MKVHLMVCGEKGVLDTSGERNNRFPFTKDANGHTIWLRHQDLKGRKDLAGREIVLPSQQQNQQAGVMA